MKGLLIEAVLEDGIGAELGIEPGDRLLSINGFPLRDIIDYNYHATDTELVLEVARPDGEIWELEVERDEEEQLGLVFEPPVPMQCGNRCIFCFVHQLPRGLRSPLYVKDEDYRLSFLYGNYVTLANISPVDLERIKSQRLSPLYVSVHATDSSLRERLLGVTGIPPILPILDDLASSRIIMHTQVVLCPGINDGPALEKTVDDLVALYPSVQSLAVVPVGLTSHRKGLPWLKEVTPDYAREFLAAWEPVRSRLAERFGEPFLFFSDEFYLKGGTDFPPLEEYGDLPQLENGVGMVPLFREEAEDVLSDAGALRPRLVTVVTGESPYRILADFLGRLGERTGVSFQPVAVANRLFGPTVTVTGLVSGRDIVAAVAGMDLGEEVIVPDVMLKEGEGIFLDDMPLEELEIALGVPVRVVPATPAGIYEALVE